MDVIFFRRTHEQKRHGSTLLESVWKCKRYEFNFFASYKCSDMHKCKMLKLPNVSKIVNPIFYKSKQYTKVLFNKMFFFPKNGGKRFALAWALRAHPHFLEKTFYWKELLCTVCVCKKWDWRFLKHLAVLTLWICACLSIFSLQKDWIRIFWTFIDSKKVNPCFFCSCVLLQKKMYPCFDFEFEKDEVLLVWVSFRILLTMSKSMNLILCKLKKLKNMNLIFFKLKKLEKQGFTVFEA